jgi:hypothetical protein
MICSIETCPHKAQFVYTASVSKRQVYACAYHIAPFRYYVQFGATVDKIEEPAKKVSRCGRNTNIIANDTPAKPIPGNR